MAATLRSVRTRIGPGIAGARAALRPWRPATADPGHAAPPPGFEAVDADTLVMEAAPAAPEAQALFRALERAGLAAAVRTPEPGFEGFAWYDRLPRIRSVITLAVVDGRTCPPHAVPVPEGGLRPPRPEAVSMRLRIAHPAGRPEEMRTVAADLALACEDDARRQAIADALARELLWLLPDDRQTIVTVCAGQVSVAFGPAPTLPPLVKEDHP